MCNYLQNLEKTHAQCFGKITQYLGFNTRLVYHTMNHTLSGYNTFNDFITAPGFQWILEDIT